MEVGDLFLPIAPAEIGVDRTTLDRAGSDQGDLDHEVVKTARLEPRERGHLRPALHLEDPHRIGSANIVIDGFFLGEAGKVDLVAVVRGGDIDRPVDRLQHPEAEEVELHEADDRAVVLVPLQHRPALHAGPLDRADLDDRTVADHHATRVDTEVAGEALELGRHRRAPGPGSRARSLPSQDRARWRHRHDRDGCHRPRPSSRRAVRPHLALQRSTTSNGPCGAARSSGDRRRGTPPLDALRPGVDLSGRVAECLGGVPHGGAGPVAHDYGHEGSARSRP